jgi:YD repeat-containing protein
VTFTRDGEGRITRITDPAGFFTAYSYDASGDLVAATDRDGHTTTYAYSATRPHFLEAITDPLGRRPIRNDALGNQIAVTDARGNVTTYEHDALNRRTKTIFPDGTFALTAYDAPRPK